ncbi:MAG: SH3 domain-containing protein [Clostridia bacterium]|nr:SH3 domain-containing protein [Clostridia bacterium]
MKKLMTIALAVMMLLGLMVPMLASAEGETMWVNCPNGKTLNLRVEPSQNARKLKQLECGTKVTVLPVSNETAGWTCVRANGKDGWVMTKFLVDTKPGKYEITERDDNFRDVDHYTVSAQPLKGHDEKSVCLRVKPNKTAKSIRRLASGDMLTVVAVGKIWSKVVDNTTGSTGFVANDYISQV